MLSNSRGLRTNRKLILEGHFMQVETRSKLDNHENHD